MTVPFRVVITDDQQSSTEIVTLLRAPDIGDALVLANGDTARVWRVITTDDATVFGTILAELERSAEKLALDDPPL